MKFLKTQKIAFLLLLGAVSLQSCSSDDDSLTLAETEVEEVVDEPEVVVIPEVITIANAAGLYPEGIDFNNNTNEFLVGSVGLGEVGVIDTETGDYTTLVTDENLVNVTGIYTDEENNRLLAVSGDLASFSLAYLGVYDLTTGEAITDGIFLNELLEDGSGAFANDIALDADNNIYVTDSASPVVYKIDGSTYEASIFVNGGDDFTPNGFGLNGIVYMDGNLIVNKTDDGALFKIPVAAPETYTQITSDIAYVSADGMEITADGNIAVLVNGNGVDPVTGVYQVTSSDDWNSVTEVSNVSLGTDEFFATTVTLANDGSLYVVNARLDLFLAEDLSQETFSIVRAE